MDFYEVILKRRSIRSYKSASQGKQLYKLRPIFSEGNFANIKSHQEFTKSRRIGIENVDIDLKLEAIVINIKKISQNLNVTLI